MARRRRRVVRRASPRRRASYTRRSAPRRRRATSQGVKMVQVDAMVYGALREKVSNMLAPITSKVPLGNIGDELVMGAVNYFVAKKASGMIKNVAMKGLVIENARLGEAIVDGSLMGGVKSAGSGKMYL